MKRFFTHTRLGKFLKRHQATLLFYTGFPLLLVSFPMSLATQSFLWVLSALLGLVLLLCSINADAKSMW